MSRFIDIRHDPGARAQARALLGRWADQTRAAARTGMSREAVVEEALGLVCAGLVLITVYDLDDGGQAVALAPLWAGAVPQIEDGRTAPGEEAAPPPPARLLH
ncbi:MAG TPA: hypothetical protein VGE72_30200 [Azospirillum sp.]